MLHLIGAAFAQVTVPTSNLPALLEAAPTDQPVILLARSRGDVFGARAMRRLSKPRLRVWRVGRRSGRELALFGSVVKRDACGLEIDEEAGVGWRVRGHGVCEQLDLSAISALKTDNGLDPLVYARGRQTVARRAGVRTALGGVALVGLGVATAVWSVGAWRYGDSVPAIGITLGSGLFLTGLGVTTYGAVYHPKRD